MPLPSKKQHFRVKKIRHPMNNNQDLINISKNLQVLAASFESTSSFCLKVDINRQQFNKYISGQHFPAQKVLAKIAKYFLME
ncbi:MAG: family transcriptional regulator, partial [Rhodoferax sp.]|nr:family transcriptional regulator [Rhodoferax sp.]